MKKSVFEPYFLFTKNYYTEVGLQTNFFPDFVVGKIGPCTVTLFGLALNYGQRESSMSVDLFFKIVKYDYDL